MAFRGFLERKAEPSIGERLATGVGSIVSGATKEYGNYQKNKQAQQEKLSKVKENLGKYVHSEGPKRYPDLFHEEDKADVHKLASDLVDRGFSKSDALDAAYASFKSSREKDRFEGRGSGKEGVVSQLLRNLRNPVEGPFDVAPGTPGRYSERKKSEAYPYGYGSALRKHPKEALSDIPISALGGLEQVADILSLGSYGNVAKKLSGNEQRSSAPLSDYLRRKTGFEDLPEEAKENIEIGDFAASFAPWMKLLGLAKGAKGVPGAGRPRPPVRKELIPHTEMPELTHQPKVSPTKNPLEGRVSGKSEGVTFKTSKGSSYTVGKDGSTIRDKAARPEHPGLGERGVQKESEKTFYLNRDDLNKLDIMQATNPHKLRVAELGDGRFGVQYLEGPEKGKFIRDTIVSPSESPKKGLHPVELWNEGKDIHFGNEIVSVNEPGKTATEMRVERTNRITETPYKDIQKKISSLEEMEREIIEPKVGKEIYEREYKGKGFEGQIKFWEKYGNFLSKEEENIIESLPIDDLKNWKSDLSNIRTSYYSGDTKEESIRNVISDIRGSIINNQIDKNKDLVKEAFSFLESEGATKEEISQAVFETLKKYLSPGDLEFVLKDLFSNSTSKSTSFNSLEGKISGRPQNATEMRVERTQPSNRIYPRFQNIQVREQQVKLQPKYVAEIETDALERAERAAQRVPKTVKGRESQQIRIHEAEKQYPIVQNSYNKASGRVRALEDEVAKLPIARRDELKPLLEAAKKDLEEATFELKQAHENLSGGSRRSGIPEQRDAAQNKILGIREAIENGEEYPISKRDYSPDLIAKAKQIEKGRKLPSVRKSDFYTQVHQPYIDAYKSRIAQIDTEIKQLPKSMAGYSQGRQLQLEKDILGKMVKSAEAEQTIQQHRFALREMAERAKAKERFAKLQKQSANPKVEKAAQEKMWKERIQDAKTPQERSQIVDDVVRRIKDKDPKVSAQAEKEGEILKEDFEKMFGERGEKPGPSVAGEKIKFGEPKKGPKKPVSEPLPKGEEVFAGKTLKEKINDGLNQLRRLQSYIDDLLTKVPLIGKYEWGRDVIIGAVGAFIDELHKEYKFPLTAGDTSLVFGRPGRGGYRFFIRNQSKKIVKEAIKEFKIYQAENAYESRNREKFQGYSKSIQKEALERRKR